MNIHISFAEVAEETRQLSISAKYTVNVLQFQVNMFKTYILEYFHFREKSFSLMYYHLFCIFLNVIFARSVLGPT